MKKLGLLSGLMLAATLTLSAQTTSTTSEAKEVKTEKKACCKKGDAKGKSKACCSKKKSCNKGTAKKEEETSQPLEKK